MQTGQIAASPDGLPQNGCSSSETRKIAASPDGLPQNGC
jgi:hypothetical protein